MRISCGDGVRSGYTQHEETSRCILTQTRTLKKHKRLGFSSSRTNVLDRSRREGTVARKSAGAGSGGCGHGMIATLTRQDNRILVVVSSHTGNEKEIPRF